MESVLTKQGVLKLHVSLWHGSVEGVWIYLGPALDKWGASMAQRRLVKTLLREVVGDCDICARVRRVHGKLSQQPKSIGVVARGPNEWVVGDVAEYVMEGRESMKLVHLMDVASRWSLILVVRRPGVKAKDVGSAMSRWIFHFGGAPSNVLFDNGKEFIGMDLSELGSALGVQAFYSPP